MLPSRGWCDRRSGISTERGAATVTLLWFAVWLIADLIGDHESLLFAPPNVFRFASALRYEPGS